MRYHFLTFQIKTRAWGPLVACAKLYNKEMTESGFWLWTESVFFPSRHCLESILAFADCETELSMCERLTATVHVHQEGYKADKCAGISVGKDRLDGNWDTGKSNELVGQILKDTKPTECHCHWISKSNYLKSVNLLLGLWIAKEKKI